MNKSVSFIAIFVLLFSSSVIKAQSIGNIFSSVNAKDVVASVTGGSPITVDNVSGEWHYLGAAVELSSDNVLSNAAGTLATSQMEDKLDALYSKVGVTTDAFSFVFNKDLTFTSRIGSKNLSGTYTIDTENGKITLHYGLLGKVNLGSLTASVTLVNTSMSILFNADKLLTLFSSISSVTSNATIAAVSALADKYDGIKIGYELEGEAKAPTASSAVEAASSAISKWFK